MVPSFPIIPIINSIVKKDLTEMNMSENIINDSILFKDTGDLGLPGKEERRKGGAIWSDEMKEQHRERMGFYRFKRKEKKNRKN